jgi:hypothetical protein
LCILDYSEMRKKITKEQEIDLLIKISEIVSSCEDLFMYKIWNVNLMKKDRGDAIRKYLSLLKKFGLLLKDGFKVSYSLPTKMSEINLNQFKLLTVRFSLHNDCKKILKTSEVSSYLCTSNAYVYSRELSAFPRLCRTMEIILNPLPVYKGKML